MLHVDALNIAAGIAASESHELNKLLAVECLLSFRYVDMQILRRIVVVHSGRNVEFHAADSIDYLFGSLHIDEDIAVHIKAEEGFYKLLAHFFYRVAAIV